MDSHYSLLRWARLQRCWTLEFVSQQVGVSLHTYRRWEQGAQTPRAASLASLCQVFSLSANELGFADERSRKYEPTLLSSPKAIATASTSLSSFSPSTELLESWDQEITLYWHDYMHGEQTKLEQCLPIYLHQLHRPALTPGSNQIVAARLTSQVYQLLALLLLQRGDFVEAQAHATQALVYSQLARDWNCYVAAQIHLATIFSSRKRIGSALNAYNDALRRINTCIDLISPLLHSRIFAGLAEIQATMGREQESLQFLKLALAVFPDQPQNDPCCSYIQCDRSLLLLYEGLVFLRLGQPHYAWDALTQIELQQPGPSPRLRAEILWQRAYVSIMLGNMVQSCVYLEAAAKAALEVNSDLLSDGVYTLYEHMLALWGQEPRVRSLARLFQQK